LLCLATGLPFLGFHHENKVRSVYLSLEDNVKAVKTRLLKQISGMTNEEINLVKKGIIFEFSPFDIEAKLYQFLKSDISIKVIIIDPMSEIMVQGDLNNTSYVRKTIQMLRGISRQFDVAIIYIHHITKTAEINGYFSKLSVSGSHAFEASVRSLFFMQKEKDGSSTLGIVKGNHIRDEWKYPKKKLTLNLDEGTMTYHQTIRIDLKKKKNNNPEDSIDWWLIFNNDDEELPTKEIKKRIKDQYGMAERSIERIISEVLTPYRISIGVYRSPGFDFFQL
jgi:RecA-family ATPase